MSVEDPNVIDFVAHAPNGEVVLVMVENRRWDGTKERLFELQEKINAYVAFVREGKLLKDYPYLADKPVRLELRSVDEPDPVTKRFLNLVSADLTELGLPLSIRKIAPKPHG